MNRRLERYRQTAVLGGSKGSLLGRVLVVSVLTTFAACITVNIYFPAPEVRAAAEEIVEETWGGGDRTADGQGSSLPHSLLDWLGPRSAMAQQPDLNVSTAAIRALKSAMKARSAQLKPSLAAGNVGIGNDGMLVLRDPGEISLKEKASLRRLVDAENEDRMSLYREIADANDFGKDRVKDIQDIFAQTWIEKAESGWWVQTPGGAWEQAGS